MFNLLLLGYLLPLVITVLLVFLGRKHIVTYGDLATIALYTVTPVANIIVIIVIVSTLDIWNKPFRKSRFS